MSINKKPFFFSKVVINKKRPLRTTPNSVNHA